MKKLYFLNEEESIRILNLHKDATKRQYLKEADFQFPGLVQTTTTTTTIDPNTYHQFQGVKLNSTPEVQTPTPEVQTPTPVVQKPVQSVNKPLVMDIQKKLREKNINLGNTGDNKDGVDGVMGKKTLDGIISLLGKPEPLKTIDLTTKPLATKPTTVAGATAGTPAAAAGTPVVAGATAETPTAAAATTGTSPQATEKDL
jgi:hypothetical protein